MAGENVVTVAYLPHLVVEVLALASGKEIARFDLPRFAPDIKGVWAGGVVSVPDALVLVASEGRKPHAIRIG